MAMSNDFILHRLVWDNNYEELINVLKDSKNKSDIEAKDPRGRTPLLLAVTLNHFECVRELLQHGASVLASHGGWTVLQEAISTKNETLLRLLMHYYYTDCLNKCISLVAAAFEDINKTPDFYTEIHWNIKTWLPFISRFCPHDDVKIWKSKARIRFDSCLAGMGPKYDMLKGELSYIIRMRDDKKTLELDHILHDHKEYVRHIVKPLDILNAILELGPSEHFIDNAMKNPNVANGLDHEKREFKRFQKGFFVKTDYSEYISGHFCEVFDTSGFTFNFITRTEHMDIPESKSYLSSMLGFFTKSPPEKPVQPDNPHNPHNVTSEEYFDSNVDLTDRDIGRIKRLSTEKSNFPAKFWLCKEYSHLIAAQLKPFFELMTMFASDSDDVSDVLLNKWPSGFPMKIQIPMMHVANFVATFCNINALDHPVNGITYNSPELVPTSNVPISVASSASLQEGLGDKKSDWPVETSQAFSSSISNPELPLLNGNCYVDTKPVDPISIDPAVFDTPGNYQMKMLVEWTKEKVIPLIEEKCGIEDGYMKSSGFVTGLSPNNPELTNGEI